MGDMAGKYVKNEYYSDEERPDRSTNKYGEKSIGDQISADGSIVVGSGTTAAGSEAIRWTGGTATGLGSFPGDVFPTSASGVSADGSIIVGSGSSAAGPQAYRWANSGTTGLGVLPGGSYSAARGVTDDGATVVGFAQTPTGAVAFVWTEDEGMRSIRDILVNDYGLDLTG